MKSSFNTTIKVLNKFHALQKRIDKAGNDWNDCDSFNRVAREVYFALGTNGLRGFYSIDTTFADFLTNLHDRREAFAPHGYGISNAQKTWGKDIICYVVNILNDAYRSCYTATHDLDDLDLRDDDIERICDAFLSEIKTGYSRYYNFTTWTKFIREMNVR